MAYAEFGQMPDSFEWLYEMESDDEGDEDIDKEDNIKTDHVGTQKGVPTEDQVKRQEEAIKNKKRKEDERISHKKRKDERIENKKQEQRRAANQKAADQRKYDALWATDRNNSKSPRIQRSPKRIRHVTRGMYKQMRWKIMWNHDEQNKESTLNKAKEAGVDSKGAIQERTFAQGTASSVAPISRPETIGKTDAELSLNSPVSELNA
jgi:hypothetical protein